MWKIMYHPEAEQELKKLDGSQQKIVLKAIIKVSQNPESNMKGGYGKPLGNNLSGLFKIKLKGLGLRIVYKLEQEALDNIMRIVVISMREGNEVYEVAAKRESR